MELARTIPAILPKRHNREAQVFVLVKYTMAIIRKRGISGRNVSRHEASGVVTTRPK